MDPMHTTTSTGDDATPVTADDFSRAPWSYPGTAVGRSDPIDAAARAWLAESEAGVPESGHGPVLVLAVGSNASRSVMRRKFERYGITSAVSFLRARVSGLRVGHSAHVSAPGYIPAAPVVEPGAQTDLVASLLDPAGLAALDATEPNYVRHELSAERFPLELDLGLPAAGGAGRAGRRAVVRPRSFSVYLSRHGVLGPPGERALRLHGQEQLFARLTAECRGFGRLVGHLTGAPRETMRTLSASADLRAGCRWAFQSAGWVLSAGLD